MSAGLNRKFGPRRLRDATGPWRRIDFVKRKYGRELLIDVGWIHEYETFILTDEPHALAFHEILLVTRGAGRLWLDDRPFTVAPGRVFFTAPGQVRRWHARRVDGVCLFFTADFLIQFFQDALFIHSLHFWTPQRMAPTVGLGGAERLWLLSRLADMRRELCSIDDDSAHMLRAILYEILIRLNRLYVARCGAAADGGAAHKAVRFRQLLEQHLCTRHRVADYAGLLGITPGHLNELAWRHLGQSAGAIIRQRLTAEACRRLLHTDVAAVRIADDLGFVDPAYFSRFFKRETGASPTTYRRDTIREKYQSSGA